MSVEQCRKEFEKKFSGQGVSLRRHPQIGHYMDSVLEEQWRGYSAHLESTDQPVGITESFEKHNAGRSFPSETARDVAYDQYSSGYRNASKDAKYSDLPTPADEPTVLELEENFTKSILLYFRDSTEHGPDFIKKLMAKCCIKAVTSPKRESSDDDTNVVSKWQPIESAPKDEVVLIKSGRWVYSAYFDTAPYQPRWFHFDSWGDRKPVQAGIEGWMPAPTTQIEDGK
jgi:hypothetical protein